MSNLVTDSVEGFIYTAPDSLAPLLAFQVFT
jgi:hypothetical protein